MDVVYQMIDNRRGDIYVTSEPFPAVKCNPISMDGIRELNYEYEKS